MASSAPRSRQSFAFSTDPAVAKTRALAEFSRAVLNGLSLTRLVDPEAITETTFDTTLAMLYDAMGADEDDPAP